MTRRMIAIQSNIVPGRTPLVAIWWLAGICMLLLGSLDTGVSAFCPVMPSSSISKRVSWGDEGVVLVDRSGRSRTELGLKRGGKKKKKVKDGTIAVNRLAYRNYEIVDTLEAGISLLGTEVKSVRKGQMNLRDGYVRAEKDGRSCTLCNVHIAKHDTTAAYFQHDEMRPRPLLLHKQEALKLKKQTEIQGFTMVPLKAYFNDANKVKLQIALVRGKNVRDKRQTIKDREGKREADRMVKNFRI